MPAGNLETPIKQLIAEIQTLSRAIAGMGGMKEAKDLSTKIAEAMQEQYDNIRQQVNASEGTKNIGDELKKVADSVLDQELKKQDINKDLLKNMKEVLEKSKGLPSTYAALEKGMEKIERDIQVWDITMSKAQKEALKLAKTDIASMMKKMESLGFFGKIGKVVASTFVGAESSARREKVEMGVAAKMHPDMDFGVKGGALEGAIAGLGKFAAIGAIILPIVKALFDNLMKIAGISATLVKNTGFTERNIAKLEKGVIESSVELKYFGVELEQIQESASALAGEFKNVWQVSKESVETVTALSKMTGISATNMARLYRILAVNWRMTDTSIKSFSETLRNKATVYGLSFSGIMQDISANAENLTMWFQGSVDALQKAAIRAAQLQSSLSTQVTMAEKFSHWADAIQNSFMLSAITGRQFNASLLYMNAALGNSQAVVDEIMNGLAASSDTWMKIVPMAKAVSQTLGVPFEELRTMMENKTIEKMLAAVGIGGEQLAHGIKAVRQMAGPKGDVYSVGKSLSGNLTELNKRIAESQKLEKELQAGKESELAKTGQEFAKAIGLAEIMSPQEKILQTIGGIANEILTTLSSVIAPALQPLASFFQSTGLSQSIGSAKGGVPGWMKTAAFLGLGPIALLANQFDKKAMGGMTQGPTIAGEAGTEAVLPFSGPGKKSFTEPFLASTAIEPLVREIKEAIAGLTRVPIQVKVYLDSAVLAEKLDKYEYSQALR